MEDKYTIIGLAITIMIPLIAWLKKVYFVGPELVIQLQKTGSASSFKAASWKNEPIDGIIDARTALYLYKLEWEYLITIRNNSEHTAFNMRMAFEDGKKPFTNVEAISELKPLAGRDEITLKATFTMHEECMSKDRTDMDSTPAILQNSKILLKYDNSSKTAFYTTYDHAKKSNKRIRIRPAGFIDEVSNLSNERIRTFPNRQHVYVCAAVAILVILAMATWLRPVTNIPSNEIQVPNAKKKNQMPLKSVEANDRKKREVTQYRKITNPTPKYQLNATVINSAVGDNAKVTNNFNSPYQRHLTNEELHVLIENIPSKDGLIYINLTSNDSETYTYASEILQKLLALGYNVNKQLANGSTAFPNNENFIIEDYNIFVKQQ